MKIIHFKLKNSLLLLSYVVLSSFFFFGCKKDPVIEIDITQSRWKLQCMEYKGHKEKFDKNDEFVSKKDPYILSFEEFKNKEDYYFYKICNSSLMGGLHGEVAIPAYERIEFNSMTSFNEMYPYDERTWIMIDILLDVQNYALRSKKLYIYGYWGELEFINYE